MSQMHRQSLVAYGKPLCETVADCPSARGGEVLVRIERCGVCHPTCTRKAATSPSEHTGVDLVQRSE
jgi:D-arabinose 1-dehydrogenase-like Zn-dependent alcohol dehydrogenase